jgi:hypothetical protein
LASIPHQARSPPSRTLDDYVRPTQKVPHVEVLVASEDDALLVGVQVDESPRSLPERVTFGWFHLHDLGTEIRERLATECPRGLLRELHNHDVV